MTGRPEGDPPARGTTVVLRADIYQQAVRQGIDISDACNRALAAMTGIAYATQQPGKGQPPAPVIIARDGSSASSPDRHTDAPSPALHPVINADDPSAPAKVAKATMPVKRPRTVLPDVPKAAGHTVITGGKPGHREQKAGRGKKQKGDALRSFFSSQVVRTDEAGAWVAKDELYERFVRFCHNHRITPVPERKAVTIALKNRFALAEERKTGIPYWAGIRLED